MSKRSLFPLSIPLSRLVAVFAILVGSIGSAWLKWHESKILIVIDVPVRDLPAYYQIKSSDLTKKYYFLRNLPNKTLKNNQKIIGHYTLTKLSEKKPITEQQINSKIDSSLLRDTTVVGIPATSSMTFNGSLQAGDIVDITLIPAKTKGVPSAILFSNILVLDVHKTSIIVIALPLNRQTEFATYSPGATLMISRKL